MKKVLLLGADGQVGTFIDDLAYDMSDIKIIRVTRNEIDLLETDTIFNKICEYEPDVVINAAAYTNVDKAEEFGELNKVMRINATAVLEIAKACDHLSASLIHISTDYVFDGENESEYKVDDTINPLNWYGTTKALGEKYALDCDNCIVVRTSWVHSNYGVNFETTMRKLFETKEQISVVDDQYGRPTHAKDLALFCLQSASQDIHKSKIVHYAGDNIMTWYDLAKSIHRKMHNPKTKVINRISSEEYPTKAKRPKYSVLDIS